MLKNYFLTAWRIMSRQKAYSAINILGLSLGMAVSILIIYVVDELSYDKFHKDGERIYRINMAGSMNGNDFNMGYTPAPMPAALKDEVPEVEEAIRIGMFRTMPIQNGGKTFTEPYMLVAEANFFDFFGFKLLEGDPKTALEGTNKVVLTKIAAKKYFGEEDPIEKIILRGSEKRETVVSGIAEDPPHNSHLVFGMILSAESWAYMKDDQWSSNNIHTYFKLYAGADPNNVKTALDQFVEKYIGPELENFLGLSMQALRDQGSGLGYYLIPLPDIHLYSETQEEMKPEGKVQYLYIFGSSLFVQDMSFEEYNPPSTLVVPQNPVKRAKFPFIDIHCYQWNVSQATVNRLVREMDEINMGVMVNLSGRRGAAGDIDGQEYMFSMIRRFNGVAPGRFIVFTNLSFRNFGAAGWIERAVAEMEKDVQNGANGLKIYKSLGLSTKDVNGKRVPIDHPDLDPVWKKCGGLGILVIIHAADPEPFWQPTDAKQ